MDNAAKFVGKNCGLGQQQDDIIRIIGILNTGIMGLCWEHNWKVRDIVKRSLST